MTSKLTGRSTEVLRNFLELLNFLLFGMIDFICLMGNILLQVNFIEFVEIVLVG